MNHNPSSSAPLRKSQFWCDPRVRALVWQGALLAMLVAAASFLVANVLANLEARNIASGFGFLRREAGFAIGESLIAYEPSDSYGRAILVGLLNTLRVSAVCIVLATLLGTLLGIARLSSNWLVARLAGGYVELMRNIPLLLQLLFWYAILTENLPGPRQALQPLPGVYLSNRGVALPALQGESLLGLLTGFALAVPVVVYWLNRTRSGSRPFYLTVAFAAVALLGGSLAGWMLAGGGAIVLDQPVLRGFNFRGGITISPEFAALALGLVVYTSAFTAEVVRAGILAVGRGQWAAAAALGLSRRAALRHVVLPQALRVIVPPMTSQYLNVTKNSSLAIAIGYPDIVSVVNTTLNQTGQAIEGIAIIMAAYLCVSLLIALAMNLYNRRIALVER